MEKVKWVDQKAQIEMDGLKWKKISMGGKHQSHWINEGLSSAATLQPS